MNKKDFSYFYFKVEAPKLEKNTLETRVLTSDLYVDNLELT